VPARARTKGRPSRFHVRFDADFAFFQTDGERGRSNPGAPPSAALKKDDRKMKKAFVPVLVYVVTLASGAMAQNFQLAAEVAAPQLGIATADLAPAGVTCFKLEQPANSCVIASKPIVNYVTPNFNVIDLNGAWVGPGGERPYIYLYGDSQYSSGYTIMVDMTLLNRPDGFGYLVDASTIAVVFPDDRDYTGTIVDGSIHWSNNSVWTKL
jgi:hypothetical protein